MAFAKVVAATVALLATIRVSTGCSCPRIYWTPCNYVEGSVPGYDEGQLVIRATALSRSEQNDVNGYATYTVEVTTVFEGDTGGESEISFITANNSAACGVSLEIGQEYVLALAPAVDNSLEPAGIEGQLSIEACGLYRVYDWLPDEERVDLEAGCAADDPCLGSCSEFQECVQYERNGRYYCSDTCDNYPCASGEVCSTKAKKWCRSSGFEGCPERRSCRAS